MISGMITKLAIIQLFSGVIINDCISHMCWNVVLCNCLWEFACTVLEPVVYHLWFCPHLLMDIHWPLLVPSLYWCCALNLIDLLCQLGDSCRVTVFQRVLIVMFNCVTMYYVLNGV